VITKLERSEAAKTFTQKLYLGVKWAQLYRDKLRELSGLISKMTPISERKSIGSEKLKRNLAILLVYLNGEVEDCRDVLDKATQVFFTPGNKVTSLKDATQLIRHAAEIYWECEEFYKLIERAENLNVPAIVLIEAVVIFDTWPACANPNVKRPRKEKVKETILQTLGPVKITLLKF